MTLRKRLAKAILKFLRVSNVYEGAQFSPDRSLLWQALQDARIDIDKATREELQRKFRYFEANSPVIQRLADVTEQFVVGTGLQLMPSSSSDDFNRRAKEAYEEWCESPSVGTYQSMADLEQLWVRCWAVDGEAFISLTNKGGGLPAVQSIEAHRIKTPELLSKSEGKTIIDGININPTTGLPMSYWLSTVVDGKTTFGDPIPARFMLHLFDAGRPGQYRGLPWAYAATNRLHDCDDIHRLEMQAAKDNARISRFIKTKNGEIDTAAALRGEITNDDATRLRYYESVLGAEAKALYQGDDVLQFGGERPSVVTVEFMKSLIADVCNAWGIPMQMAFPESIQGTVERAILDAADVYFKSKFKVFASVKMAVYRYWLDYAVRNVPGLMRKPEGWNRAMVLPPRSCNVDPGYRGKAMMDSLAAGATNWGRIYGDLGLDWRTEFHALKDQIDYAKTIGLDISELGVMLRAQSLQPKQEEEKKDEKLADDSE